MPKKNNEVVTDELRELATRPFDSYGNYQIYRKGGGHVPSELNGMFTTPTLAAQALSRYLEKMGIANELKKTQAAVKTITELDHTYDEV